MMVMTRIIRVATSRITPTQNSEKMMLTAAGPQTAYRGLNVPYALTRKTNEGVLVFVQFI